MTQRQQGGGRAGGQLGWRWQLRRSRLRVCSAYVVPPCPSRAARLCSAPGAGCGVPRPTASNVL
eukprot:1749801-Alexandrium_andersonii.AAC.1